MQTVSVTEMRSRSSALLSAVAEGETIIITRRGVPVATLIPMPAAQQPHIDALIAEWEEVQHTISLGGLSIREMINEGRR